MLIDHKDFLKEIWSTEQVPKEVWVTGSWTNKLTSWDAFHSSSFHEATSLISICVLLFPLQHGFYINLFPTVPGAQSFLSTWHILCYLSLALALFPCTDSLTVAQSYPKGTCGRALTANMLDLTVEWIVPIEMSHTVALQTKCLSFHLLYAVERNERIQRKSTLCLKPHGTLACAELPLTNNLFDSFHEVYTCSPVSSALQPAHLMSLFLGKEHKELSSGNALAQAKRDKEGPMTWPCGRHCHHWHFSFLNSHSALFYIALAVSKWLA